MPESLSLGYVLSGLAVIGAITVLLRLAPFVALARLQESRLVAFLGLYMPAGVMVILVMYTLTGTTTDPASWVPAVVALVITIGLHLWRGSAVLSVLIGTAVYVALASLMA